ncbi:MAG: peptide deformylase [Gemmatimonadales bacterium]
MGLRPLHLLGSPLLREPSARLETVDDDVRQLVADLFDTMDAAEGVGLAANQVGVALRVAVVGVEDDRFVLINPAIIESEGKDTAEEGCLSVPDIYADVTRPARIVVETLDESGEPYRIEADGLKARVIQHEMDHLDGMLFLDRLSPLKRRVLTKRWKKSGKDTPNHLLEVTAASTTTD